MLHSRDEIEKTQKLFTYYHIDDHVLITYYHIDDRVLITYLPHR